MTPTRSPRPPRRIGWNTADRSGQQRGSQQVDMMKLHNGPATEEITPPGTGTAGVPVAGSRDGFLAHRAKVVDPQLRAKLYDVPQAIHEWLEPYGGLENRHVLDFGCGFGETAAGIALGHGASSVHGVDVQDKPGQCGPMLASVFGLESLPANLRFSRITEHGPAERDAYDVVVSWSVLEHVTRGLLSSVLGALHDSLRPGGIAFFQISPLYFSPEGAHLGVLGYQNWEHLLKQTSEVLDDIANLSRCQSRAESPPGAPVHNAEPGDGE